ncbi:MAG: transporter substrate-binding domain-containing protein [Deferribacterales bacterium]
MFYSGATAHEAGDDPYFHINNSNEQIAYTEEEKQYIINKGMLNMCTDPNWMPYEGFDEQGGYIGVAADYHNIISHLTGLKYNVIHTQSWSETIELAKAGKCDLMSILNKTPERDDYLDFTDSYIKSPSVFVTRDQDKFINGVDDLKGQTLAIVKGYMVDEIIRKDYPEINRIYANNIQEALKMVSKGQAFATVGSLLEMSYNMRQMGLLNLKITGDAKFGFDLRIGVRKGDKVLLSVINKALAKIGKEDRNEILNKWISIKYQKGYDYSLIMKVVAGFLILIAFIGGKTILSAKYNKKLLSLYNELLDAKNELQRVNKDLERKVADETSRRLENERLLMQQSKLAAMGDMIGAIAHQWRQPLNAVGIIIQDLEDDYEAGTATLDSIKQSSSEAMNVIMQMSQTITDFSNFFKPDKSSECFKLCKAINDVAGMMLPQLKSHNIKLHMVCMDNDLDGKLKENGDPFDCCSNYCVHGYPNEFKHVILNLLKNAMDALDPMQKQNKYIHINITTDAENYITIEIKDNGGGIEAEHIARIFEPYFSTKMEGKGVGIGLYMSKQILENMNGKLWFENKDEGAAFFIKLKLCDHPQV